MAGGTSARLIPQIPDVAGEERGRGQRCKKEDDRGKEKIKRWEAVHHCCVCVCVCVCVLGEGGAEPRAFAFWPFWIHGNGRRLRVSRETRHRRATPLMQMEKETTVRETRHDAPHKHLLSVNLCRSTSLMFVCLYTCYFSHWLIYCSECFL